MNAPLTRVTLEASVDYLVKHGTPRMTCIEHADIVLAHDAALRARVEALEQYKVDADEVISNQSRSLLDLAQKIYPLEQQLAAVTQERDKVQVERDVFDRMEAQNVTLIDKLQAVEGALKSLTEAAESVCHANTFTEAQNSIRVLNTLLYHQGQAALTGEVGQCSCSAPHHAHDSCKGIPFPDVEAG